MILKVKKLLKQERVSTLRKLSSKTGVSLNKIKNISCGRTSFKALFTKRKQYRVCLKHAEPLAELIGVVLGDGNIFKFPRCQRLTISCNAFHTEYIEYLKKLVKVIFNKEPSIVTRSKAECSDLRLYMQDIDKAIGLPAGSKLDNAVEIPEWIFKRKRYIRKCLKGLFETDGHYGLSKEHYVEYIQFCNEGKVLRKSAFKALKSLGYSPQLGKNYVRLARKVEVRRFISDSGFTRPFPSLAN